ncbi:MAG TPA: metallophosphoesterase [Mycobacteriales bacterium]|jgi:predicted MPP superfamily phosphohydrolase|nr:metallophosphoesterase [Mycobacteriales bacterium]
MPAAVWIPLAAVGIGVLCVLYAWLYERKAFRLRRVTVAVLPPGSPELTVLHLSDMHITADQQWKIRWVRALASLEPDLVIDTGDNLAGLDGVPLALDALGPLLERPGAFVPGSNDWFAPTPKNPARYLRRPNGDRLHYGQRLPWGELRSAFTASGWLDLTHRRTTIELRGVTVELAGVSDAHLLADHYDRIAGPVHADVAIGLSHSPEPRVIDAFAADGFSLVMSGHTHGGQLRVPGFGALVTNCGLERKRARGLSRWPRGGYLHVSAGLGTSPYAPVRFACHPEATLLTLTAKPA